MQPSVANASNRCNDAAQRCKRISPLRFLPRCRGAHRGRGTAAAVEGVRASRARRRSANSRFSYPQTSLIEGGGPSADGGRSTQAVKGVFSRWKAYSFPKLKYMRQNAEPCAGLRRILLILYLIRRGQSMSLPFSGGNIRPERRKFNKSNRPLSPPLTALKFLNIHTLFFRNSLDFAACHRLQ